MYFSYIWAGLVQTFGFEWYLKGALNVNTHRKKPHPIKQTFKKQEKKNPPHSFSVILIMFFFPLRLIDWYIYKKKVNISITLLYHLINLSHRLKSRDIVIVLFVFSKKSDKSSTHKYRLELKKRKIHFFQFLFCISFCCSNAEWHVEKLNITYSSVFFPLLQRSQFINKFNMS